MHKSILDATIASVRLRDSQGDCPTEPAFSVEHLEGALLTLAGEMAQPAYAVREALEVSASKAERNRIVDYLRDFAKRVEPKSASANNFNAAADAIESGHAFPGGNPDPALASDPAPAGEAVEPVEDDVIENTTRLWWFLHILDACGKHGTYANDEPGEWVAAFCDDADPTDTFNLACNLKLAICTHNSMDETSRIWISDAGKAWLAAHSAPEDTARLREDLERVTRERDDARKAPETATDDRERLVEALREARQWVEANTAQVRGLSLEAAAPGEAMLRKIDAALAPEASR